MQTPSKRYRYSVPDLLLKYLLAPFPLPELALQPDLFVYFFWQNISSAQTQQTRPSPLFPGRQGLPLTDPLGHDGLP